MAMSSYMRIVVKIFVGAVPVALWLGFVCFAWGCNGDAGKGSMRVQAATGNHLLCFSFLVAILAIKNFT
jgi:hypothetical protein